MLPNTIQGGGYLELHCQEPCLIVDHSSTTRSGGLSLHWLAVSSSSQPRHLCQTGPCLHSPRAAPYQRHPPGLEAVMRRSSLTQPPHWQPPSLTITVTSSRSVQGWERPPTVAVEVLLQLQLRSCSCLEWQLSPWRTIQIPVILLIWKFLKVRKSYIFPAWLWVYIENLNMTNSFTRLFDSSRNVDNEQANFYVFALDRLIILAFQWFSYF